MEGWEEASEYERQAEVGGNMEGGMQASRGWKMGEMGGRVRGRRWLGMNMPEGLFSVTFAASPVYPLLRLFLLLFLLLFLPFPFYSSPV